MTCPDASTPARTSARARQARSFSSIEPAIARPVLAGRARAVRRRCGTGAARRRRRRRPRPAAGLGLVDHEAAADRVVERSASTAPAASSAVNPHAVGVAGQRSRGGGTRGRGRSKSIAWRPSRASRAGCADARRRRGRTASGSTVSGASPAGRAAAPGPSRGPCPVRAQRAVELGPARRGRCASSAVGVERARRTAAPRASARRCANSTGRCRS